MFNVTRDHNVFGLQRLLAPAFFGNIDARPTKHCKPSSTHAASAPRHAREQHLTPKYALKYQISPIFFVFSSSSRNSVPQSPNFPVANASAHETVLQRVTEMFKLNFPYTTVYPALGNLDVLHPWILERESSSASASSREADHYRSTSRGHKKRRKWLQQDHHYTARCESPMTSASDKFSL